MGYTQLSAQLCCVMLKFG